MSDHNWDELRDKIIGLGEQSARKSYFPELQKKITELEDRENNLRTLLNSMIDAVIILDDKAQLMEVNTGMLRMYRMPDNETALAYGFMAYSHQVNDVLLNQIIAETLKGIPQLVDWKARCPLTEDVFDAEISFHATRWNQTSAVIATVRDISFRKQMEQRLLERERMLMQQNEKLRTLNEELAESNDCIAKMNEQLHKTRKKAIESDRLKSAFLANMSHEIRTPMNGIIGFASLLAFPDNDKEAMAQYVSIINNCSQQLLTIIDDIVDVSKIESGQVTLSRRPIHLNTMMNELYTMYRASVNDEIDLKVENAFPDDDCMLYTDPDRLRQVINNLINNAVKFTQKGTITFGYRNNKKMLEFYVTDTGIGISPDHQAMIFKRFRQAENITHASYGGTGLGLTISKALVHLMGGKIRVKSNQGSGATFYFTHPYSADGSNEKNT